MATLLQIFEYSEKITIGLYLMNLLQNSVSYFFDSHSSLSLTHFILYDINLVVLNNKFVVYLQTTLFTNSANAIYVPTVYREINYRSKISKWNVFVYEYPSNFAQYERIKLNYVR